MIQDSNAANLRRAVMPLVILRLLKEQDMYGYQLVQEIVNRSEGDLVTQEGSLYPVLYRLEEKGYLSLREVPVKKRMRRIYYHLEAPGEAYLAQLEESFVALSRGVMRILQVEN